jgi:hypothetical protein
MFSIDSFLKDDDDSDFDYDLLKKPSGLQSKKTTVNTTTVPSKGSSVMISQETSSPISSSPTIPNTPPRVSCLPKSSDEWDKEGKALSRIVVLRVNQGVIDKFIIPFFSPFIFV